MKRTWADSYCDAPLGVPDWVDPSRCNEKWSHPYSYSEFFLWRPREREALQRCHAVYSDRLQQWDYEKFKAAGADIPRRFDQFTREDATRFLTAYYGKPVTAVALAEGCNVSSGYPYWIFWYADDPA